MGEEEQASPVSVEGKLSVTDLFGLGAATKHLTPAVTEIIKAVGGGIGKVYEPASIYLNERAKNAADRHDALADAKAYLHLTTRSPAVLEAMKERILGTEYRRQENIIDAQAEAIKIAQTKKTDEPVHEINPDFMASWIDGVKDVSETYVRNAWSRMLAEAPFLEGGRVAKPVVDFLKSLDSNLARALRDAHDASLITNGLIPYMMADADEIVEEVGIGGRVEISRLSLLDGHISLRSTHPMWFFQMSVRARMLANLVFPPVADEVALKDFLKRLPHWLSSLTMSPTSQGLTLSVATGRNMHAYFSVRYYREDDAEAEEKARQRVAAFSEGTVRAKLIKKMMVRLAGEGRLHYLNDENLAY